MSRLWPDRHVAVLTPERALLARTRGPWHAGLEPLAEAPCAGAHRQAQLDALSTLLPGPGRARGELRIVLSSHLVRFLLVPWRPEVGSPAEHAAFAAICCEQTFGGEPDGRAIVSARERAPGARVAAALDQTLLQGLREVACASALRLTSVQPYLGAAFDALRRWLPRRDFLFLLAEPTRSCVLVARSGRWHSLRSLGCSSRPQALAELLEREAQLTGLADDGMPAVFVHAPGQEPATLPPCHGVTPRWLAWPGAAPADPLLAMAQAGA